MFEEWWKEHMFDAGCNKDVAKGIYESAILDAADWLRPQRNETLVTGEEFANTLVKAL